MSETMIKSADIQGMHITGVEGTRLGTVRELFVDLAAGGIDFLIVEAARPARRIGQVPSRSLVGRAL